MKTLRRTAFDCSHVKSVTAWALVHPESDMDGGCAGRIVANFSDNPAGSVCTATVHLWRGPLRMDAGTTGNAGGGGYDKFSAAVGDALNRAGIDCGDLHGAGDGAVRKFLESKGYRTIPVI
jgi:hypothetical protein